MITLISGDSWSVGEWKNSQTGGIIQHAGLAQYLHDHGHHVINVGQSSSSNRESVLRLNSFFFNNQHLLSGSELQVVVFQTEWIRDFAYMDKEDEDYYNQPAALIHRLISRFYYDLSALAERYKVKCYLIGGAGDALVIDDFSTIYRGVEVVCQSMVNLLVNGQDTTQDPVFALWSYTNKGEDFLKLFKKHATQEDQANALLDEITKGQDRTEVLYKNPELFYPDGTHPNRHAHRLLFDFLQQHQRIVI